MFKHTAFVPIMCLLSAFLCMQRLPASTPPIFVTSLESDGIVLKDSSTSDFVAALNPSRNKLADVLLPYALLLRNDTHENVIAYSIRWVCHGLDWKVVPRELTLWNFDTYHGGNALPPHSSRVVSSVIGVGTAYVPGVDAYLNDIERTRSFLEQQQSISVSVDLIVFEDGRVIGPDIGRWRARLQAHLEAESYIAALVRQSSGSPESLARTLRSLYDNTRNALGSSEQYPRGALMANFRRSNGYDDAYRFVLANYAGQLLEYAETHGVEGMIKSVQEFTSAKVYPRFHQ